MLETRKFVRKPFYIDAAQVTPENIADVAKWAGGEVRTGENDVKYVKVKVHRPLDDKQTQAFVGDWVLSAPSGFKVYTAKAFANSFEAAGDEVTLQDTKAPARPKPGPRGPRKPVTIVQAPIPAENL
jgi:hypothetical protein